MCLVAFVVALYRNGNFFYRAGYWCVTGMLALLSSFIFLRMMAGGKWDDLRIAIPVIFVVPGLFSVLPFFLRKIGDDDVFSDLKYSYALGAGFLLICVLWFSVVVGNGMWFFNQCAVLAGLAESREVGLVVKKDVCSSISVLIKDVNNDKDFCIEVDSGNAKFLARPAYKGGVNWLLEFSSKLGADKKRYVYVNIPASSVLASAHFVPQ